MAFETSKPAAPEPSENEAKNGRRFNAADYPWWGVVIIVIGVYLLIKFNVDPEYNEVLRFLREGIRLTIIVTLSGYSIALVFGLITALGQLSKNPAVRNVAQLYVQIVRGVPILVQIFYMAFVIIPLVIGWLNGLGNWLVGLGLLGPDNIFLRVDVRNVNFTLRGIIALAVAYGAFSSEIFRAGIQSIEKGQLEAAQALGLSWAQSFRYIILPQAVRRVLPPLGNDFISMLKESSLISVLGVGEITQLAKKYAAASFKYPQTYNTAAFLYLTMTMLLALGVRMLERRLRTGSRR